MKTSIALTIIFSGLISTAHAADLDRFAEESRATVSPFMQKLMAENKKAVSENGPAAAIKVCKDIAPAMSNDLSRQTGWKLARVSLKVRNPLLGTPDAWEQKALQDFEKRAARGEKVETMETAEVVQEPAGKYFRYIKAVALQPGCVTCHGASEQIPDDVETILKQEYPHDKATGYAAGQIRGGISIKRPL